MKKEIKPAEDMILNRFSVDIQINDKLLLLKGLNFAPTPNPSESIENCEWINLHTHIRRIEWAHILHEDVKDQDQSLETSTPKKSNISKSSRSEPELLDDKTKTYCDVIIAKLRNLKP